MSQNRKVCHSTSVIICKLPNVVREGKLLIEMKQRDKKGKTSQTKRSSSSSSLWMIMKLLFWFTGRTNPSNTTRVMNQTFFLFYYLATMTLKIKISIVITCNVEFGMTMMMTMMMRTHQARRMRMAVSHLCVTSEMSLLVLCFLLNH